MAEEAAKAAYKASREQLASVKVESLRATCSVTATGRARKAALTLQACRQLVPAMFAPGKPSRGFVRCNICNFVTRNA